jgi:hydroxymethylpyrimidine/phosphomethylpyrimidine kinase
VAVGGGGALTGGVNRLPPVGLIDFSVGAGGGGAGVAADLKTFDVHDVWGAAVITAVTAQNTLGVQAYEAVSPELVRAQITSVVSDLDVAAAKTGMLASVEVAEAVADTVRDLGVAPLVVDPVLASGHGDPLLAAGGLEVLRDRLLPLATVVTPNLGEAALLVGHEVGDRASMESAGRALASLGPAVVMVTGGHLEAEEEEGSPDLVVARGECRWLEGPRLDAVHSHGGGCVLSAAVCAEMARGMEPADACVAAKRFVEKALAAGLALGAGMGPVDPGWGRRSP